MVNYSLDKPVANYYSITATTWGWCTARVVSADGKILRALGFAIAVADSEMVGDGDAGQ